jgi:hypothetical protein
LGEDVDDEAQPLIGGVSVACGTCDDADIHMTAGAAGLVADTDDALSATDPPPGLSRRELLISLPLGGAPSRA